MELRHVVLSAMELAGSRLEKHFIDVRVPGAGARIAGDGHGRSRRSCRQDQREGSGHRSAPRHGYALEVDRQRTATNGFRGHLAKPVDVHVLDEMIRKIQAAEA